MIKAARVSVLILLLTCSAQAGYIPNGAPEPQTTPPPPPSTVVAEEEPAQDEPAGVTDALAEAALSVLNAALALL
jgi:hypothetical protein